MDVTFRHLRKVKQACECTPTPQLSTLFHTHQHESESGRCPVHLRGEACGAEALHIFHEVTACFFTGWHEESLQSNGVKHFFIPCDASKGKKMHFSSCLCLLYMSNHKYKHGTPNANQLFSIWSLFSIQDPIKSA